MEKNEEKKFSVSEKLTALQIAKEMGGFDAMTIANNEKYLSALINRAEKILEWASSNIRQPHNPYFVRKDIEETI